MEQNIAKLYAEGKKLSAEGNVPEAIRRFTTILTLDFKHIDARVALITSYGVVNDLPLLLGILRDSAETYPNFIPFTSAYLFCLNYFNTPKETIFREHRNMMKRVERNILNPHKPVLTPITGRKIRIGYVSGDFREHSCAYLTLPLLTHHNRSDFEIFLYSNNPENDAVTERFKKMGTWREIRHLPDNTVAEQIRNDRIDILLDLSGHTVAGRISIFFHRPAPIQMSWYGYLNTIGTTAIDYRITDALLAPPGGESLYSEKIVRLPRSFLYEPSPHLPDLSPSPFLRSQQFTFASFHNLKKINDYTLQMWCTILKKVPTSRMVVTHESSGEARKHLEKRFTSRGIDPKRITLVEEKPIAEFYSLFKEVDLILDTFPYTSGVSAMHGIWMGVPTLTIEGDTELWRNCSAVNRTRGLDFLVTKNTEDFTAQATALAEHPEPLIQFRTTARDMPVVHNAPVVKNLENLYRTLTQQS